MAVDHCNCCHMPAEKCEVVLGLVGRGVDIELITHEVLYPAELSEDADRVAV